VFTVCLQQQTFSKYIRLQGKTDSFEARLRPVEYLEMDVGVAVLKHQ
jgi:hypothetical protein